MRKKNPFNVKMTDREKELMSLGKPLVCSACREISYLFPKGVGFHPYEWEMNCNLCHRYAVGLNAYVPQHTDSVKVLQKLRERHINGESTEELAKEVELLAEQFDGVMDNRECECGGILSISAKPKCIFCDIEIFNSYFHVADDAPLERT